MTTVVESTVPEILVEDAEGFVVETEESAFVIETTSSGPDVVVETVVTEVVTESAAETVIDIEPQVLVLTETAEQGHRDRPVWSIPARPSPTPAVL